MNNPGERARGRTQKLKKAAVRRGARRVDDRAFVHLRRFSPAGENPNYVDLRFRKIPVVGMSNNPATGADVEDARLHKIAKNGVETVPGIRFCSGRTPIASSMECFAPLIRALKW
jgi:hypothetical protein